MSKEPNTRDQKLIQYLIEAHGKERELEAALQAHIPGTTHIPYRRRLQQHLSETKRHAHDVERRVKMLGGSTEGGVLEPLEAVQALAMKGVALAQGPLDTLRGTGEPERMLKNAKTEFASEAQEIANYRAIETLAETVGDKQTATLARDIRRDEERMASFLERQIETLTKQVARDEIPAAERNGAAKRPAKKARRAAASSNGAKARTNGSRAKSTGSRPKARSRSGARAKAKTAA